MTTIAELGQFLAGEKAAAVAHTTAPPTVAKVPSDSGTNGAISVA